MTDNQSKDAIKLLKKIIKTPSLSKKEENDEDNVSSAIDSIGLKPKPAL